MPRQRTTLQAADLTTGALIRSTKTGKVYRLGPPKKRNVNMNVVNHCQLYYRNGKLAGTGTWWNLSNLRDAGFKFYAPGPVATLTRPADAPPLTPEVAAALTELVVLAHQITTPDGLPA